MSDRDDMNALARAFVRGQAKLPQEIHQAFAMMPKAPLAEAAYELISAQPDSELNPLLKTIANLNQGRIEDLNTPVFQSYLIAECATDEIQLRRIMNAIKAFHSINALSDNVVMAARDEDNSGRKAITRDEILRLAKKRKK